MLPRLCCPSAPISTCRCALPLLMTGFPILVLWQYWDTPEFSIPSYIPAAVFGVCLPLTSLTKAPQLCSGLSCSSLPGCVGVCMHMHSCTNMHNMWLCDTFGPWSTLTDDEGGILEAQTKKSANFPTSNRPGASWIFAQGVVSCFLSFHPHLYHYGSLRSPIPQSWPCLLLLNDLEQVTYISFSQ